MRAPGRLTNDTKLNAPLSPKSRRLARTLKIAEVFAGIGGVTGGFIDAGGYEAVFLNDKDEVARQAFVLNFPKLKDRYHVRSVRRLRGPEVLELSGGLVDGLLGCPPCQGLSPAGHRRGKDERNALLKEMHRLVWSTLPKFFVMENVPGLLQTVLYADFQQSLSGRYAITAVVLNAAEYGLPQLRRRAVVVGFRKDLGVLPSIPPPTHGGRGKVLDYSTRMYIAPHTLSGRRRLLLRQKVRLPKNRRLVTLRRALSDLPADASLTEEPLEYPRPATSRYQRLMRTGATLLWNHQAWRHKPEMVRFLEKVRPGDCPRSCGSRSRNTTYFSQAYARLHPGGLARTITTNFHNPGSGRFTHYAAPRTLTVREALRLQGFPDTFRFEGLLVSEAERLVGNAFPRPLARAIAKHIRRVLPA